MDNGQTPNPAPSAPPSGTDGNTPPATPTKQGDGTANEGAITVPDGFELIKTEDKNKLISQRDKNHNQAQANEDFIVTIAKEREIDTFLKENKDKYPDLERDDLMHLDDPDLLESTATRLQRRLQDVAQKKLENVQNAGAPRISSKDKAARLEQLKTNPKKGAFEEMINLRTA